ncbi:MAG: bifunctional oligoribonuclease/PAP phosphatase NrnA [Bacteroidales bacterium]
MADLSKYTKQLSKLFSTSGNILVICHINPDGDAIGSQLALYHYLTSAGRNTEMVSPNNLQEFLKWMDGAGHINIFTRDRKKCRQLIKDASLIIMVDFNQAGRLGEAEQAVRNSSAFKVIIDHHLDPQDFADLVITDPSKCSTTELINELIFNINEGQYLSGPYAEAVYTGIITDTGNFEHGAFTGDTLRTCAALIDYGIDKNRIFDTIYNNFSEERMRFMGFALNKRMVVLKEYECAYIFLTRQDQTDYSHVKGDTEGFVNLPLSIKGINFSTLFIEKEDHIKLSFRSKGQFPVNEFAAEYFAGGGHLNASGGDYYSSLDDTVRYFLDVLKENYWRLKEKSIS